MTRAKKATMLVMVAYAWWGVSAVFWRELNSVAPLDQLSWRVVLGFGYLAAVWAHRRSNPMRGLTRAHFRFGIASLLSVATNWAVFLWAVDNDRAVEAALGYFLMPIFSVALGVGLLGERLHVRQKGALLLAVIGITWTFVVVGALPWISLALGVSFALYGWTRKIGPWGAVDGLTFELMLIAPIVIASLVVRGALDGVDVTGDGSWSTLVLILLTGAVTVIPLLLFASAARQVPLTVVGLLQYLNPVLQFLVGWQLFDEHVSTGRLVGFAWIWAALGLVVVHELLSKRPVDGLESDSQQRIVGARERLAPEEPAVGGER